jgi:hypothetical protein
MTIALENASQSVNKSATPIPREHAIRILPISGGILRRGRSGEARLALDVPVSTASFLLDAATALNSLCRQLQDTSRLILATRRGMLVANLPP